MFALALMRMRMRTQICTRLMHGATGPPSVRAHTLLHSPSSLLSPSSVGAGRHTGLGQARNHTHTDISSGVFQHLPVHISNLTTKERVV